MIQHRQVEIVTFWCNENEQPRANYGKTIKGKMLLFIMIAELMTRATGNFQLST
ncbi:MAG: hypothetical protein ACE5HX_10540 [bacterium]